jgi:ribosome production factor 2
MQTRKMKGLKRNRDDDDGADGPVVSDDEGEDVEHDGGVEIKKIRV